MSSSDRPPPRLGRCHDCGEPGVLRANSCVECWEESDRAECSAAMLQAAAQHEGWSEERKWRSSNWKPPNARPGETHRRMRHADAFEALKGYHRGMYIRNPLERVQSWERSCEAARQRYRQERMCGSRTALNLPPYPLVRRDTLDAS